MHRRPRSSPVRLLFTFALVVADCHCVFGAEPAREQAELDYDRAQVGTRPDGRIVVPTNQVLAPVGRLVPVTDRPVDVALSPDGRYLAALAARHIYMIDLGAQEVVHAVDHAFGSYCGIALGRDGRRLYASNNKGMLSVFEVELDGKLEVLPPIALPANETAHGKSSLPAGLALSADEATLWVALNRNNTLAEIDLASAKLVREMPVGNAPYSVAVVGRKAYVSNWAGRQPAAGDAVGPSGEAAPVRVDPRRHIANDGSVSVVDLDAGRQMKEIIVGLHPSGIAASHAGDRVAVACANSDTIAVIDVARDEVVQTIRTAPDEKLLFGSAPNALAFSSNDSWLYVSNGGNNSVALIHFEAGQGRLLGCMPTAWYPAGLALDPGRSALYVANVKGLGSRSNAWQGKRQVKGKTVFGYNSHDQQGAISLMALPTAAELQTQTATVLANNRLTAAVSALAPARRDARPRPVPQRHGEPSVFRHVVYIIKENRTYDQVFGDLEQGEGSAELCIFGREVTPNHHRLAEEFVLLDNFYCSGVLSADGHQWSTEAYVTDYLEKSFGDWPRSYPYDGGDALAYAPTGFLWDNAVEHGKTLRVYGEFVTASIRWRDAARAGRPAFLDCYRDFVDNTNLIDVRATAAIKTLEPHICPTAIGFPATVPDVHRAAQFINELKGYEASGEFPNLSIVLLPNDHTAGTRPGLPTPAAAVADNDLSLGRMVEAISHSKFWKETCIFVVEDDPQAGFDHVDGHRTVALVVSPYTKRHAVDSTNYNQTSMVRTMELVLGLPPMNQFDASASSMASCFTDEPDFKPYDAVPNIVPLDQMNPEKEALADPRARHWAEVSIDLPLDDVDEADEDTLNRILWFAQRGRDDNYPAWAIAEVDEDDDEEEKDRR